jgi:hypothetical protein
VVAYLKAELGPEFAGLQDVYFGHTHKPITDYAWNGLRFHNTGAMIHGVRSRIQSFTYDPAELQYALASAADESAALAAQMKSTTGL